MDRQSASSLSLSVPALGLALAATAGVTAALTPDQILAARAVLAVWACLALAHPRNGLYAVLLSAPFFLGEPQQPFMFLLEGLVGLTLASWLVRRLAIRIRGGRNNPIPFSGWLWLLAGLVLANPPLNLKELWYTLTFLDPAQIVHLLVEGRKFHDLYALRCLILNLGGLLFLTCCLDQLRRRDLKPLGIALALICVALAGLGLAWRAGWLPRSDFYLSLNLAGLAMRHGQALLTSTAFNRQYLNEMFVFGLAFLAVIPVFTAGIKRWSALAGAALLLVAAALTGQRSPFLAVALMALVGIGLYLKSQQQAAYGRALAWAGVAVAVLAGLLAADYFSGLNLVAGRFLGLGTADKVAGVGLRPLVWNLARGMAFDYPLTGLGPGQFRLLAPAYAAKLGQEFIPIGGVVGTAHNTWLQWLAEQGIVFTLAAATLGGLIVRRGLAALTGPRRIEALAGLTALAGLVGFSLFQHVFHIAAVALPALALLAGLVLLNPPDRSKPNRTKIGIAVGLMLLILGFKIQAIVETPFRENYRAGFSYGEWQPDGVESWWTTGKRAVFYSKPNHRYIVVPVSVPHGRIHDRPQKIRMWVDGGGSVEATVDDSKWRELKLDLSHTLKKPTMIKFETDAAFNPFLDHRSPDRRYLGFLMKQARGENN